MKRDIIVIIIALFIVFLPEISSFFDGEEAISNPLDYARITDVDYKAVLVDEPNSDGKVVVTERLTFDIHAASQDNLFWELWRDLPEAYIDGVKVDYKVNSVKQVFEDQSDVVYAESPKLYWDDYDYINTAGGYGPFKWYHSEGPYDEYAAQYECVFFYVNGLYREEVVFEIEYEMSNAALRYGDVSELYLTLYSEETIKYLESFKGQILIPLKDMPDEGNYEAHTYGTNSHSFAFTESETINPGYHTFSFELDESELKFKPYNQYIEFSLISYGKDKHIFTDYASFNDYYYDDSVLAELRQEQAIYDQIPQEAKSAKIKILLLLVGATFLILLYTFRHDKRMRRKYHFYESNMKTQYFRDIPSNLDPYFASALVFSKHKPMKDEANGYSAIMLSLVRKGYIELDRINPMGKWNSNNIKIVVKYHPVQSQQETRIMDRIQPLSIIQKVQQVPVTPSSLELQATEFEQLEPLTPTEEYYFNLIVRHSYGRDISMSSFQTRVSADYENTDSFVTGVKNSIVTIGVGQGYFQRADYNRAKRETKTFAIIYVIIGILLITLVNYLSYHTRLDFAFGAYTILGIGFIISSIHLNKLSKKYILLTQYGEDEYMKWRGLYNFLNSHTLMSERTVIELPLWEQYLVYATAFGISDKVIKALKIRCPDIDMSPMLRNPYYRSTNFRSSGRHFRSVTRTASFTSRSGGFGGGGYYGGGGRGGGGGGGGH